MENYCGKRLDGRYEIREIIGVGGMAVVYKAYDVIDDRIVAIKILKEEFLANDEFRRRFKNESKAIAVLSHPNIVKVYDVSFGDRLQYIVMEYIEGITLKEYIEQQKVINWKEAVHFVTQILKALQHAHDKGIVHRDVKPQNIMLLQDGTIKVTDFGIARFIRLPQQATVDGENKIQRNKSDKCQGVADSKFHLVTLTGCWRPTHPSLPGILPRTICPVGSELTSSGNRSPSGQNVIPMSAARVSSSSKFC